MNWFKNILARQTRAAAKPFSARPTLELLEARDVPSYSVLAIQNQGVWLYNDGRTDGSGFYRQLASQTADVVAVDSAGDVVGDFPGLGVFVYNNPTNSWQQLTSAAYRASLLAISSSSGGGDWTLVGMFPGSGVFELGEGSSQWQYLTNTPASILHVYSSGTVVGEFPGHGVFYHTEVETNWHQLAQWDASILDYAAGWVVAYFPNNNWTYRLNLDIGQQLSWQPIAHTQAIGLSIDGYGDVAGSFQGIGTWIYDDDDGRWHQAAPNGASNWLGMKRGTLDGEFGSTLWVYEYDQLTPQWRRDVYVGQTTFWSFEH